MCETVKKGSHFTSNVNHGIVDAMQSAAEMWQIKCEKNEVKILIIEWCAQRKCSCTRSWAFGWICVKQKSSDILPVTLLFHHDFHIIPKWLYEKNWSAVDLNAFLFRLLCCSDLANVLGLAHKYMYTERKMYSLWWYGQRKGVTQLLRC